MNWLTAIIEYGFYLGSLGLIIYYKFVFDKINTLQVKKQKTAPPVSIIICAKNELENLKKHLPHFINQKHPQFEIIVADDHSSDGSHKWLIELALQHLNLKIIQFKQQKKHGGKKEVLSFAINEAKYEHLLLSDADCQPSSPYWALEMSSAFTEEKQLILGTGMYETTNTSVGKFMRWDAILIAIQYLSFAAIGKPYMSVGRNVAYTKRLFNSVNGFTSHLNIKSGDDDLFVQDVANNTNTTIVIGQNCQTVSPPEKTWIDFINQKSRHHSSGVKYKPGNIFLLGLFQLCILLFYSLFALGLIYKISIPTLLTIFFLKNLIQASIFSRIFVKIGVREQIIPFLFFDVAWVLFVTLINLKNLFSKNNQW